MNNNKKVGDRKLGISAVCERYDNSCSTTIRRWVKAGILPPPVYINKRRYWSEKDLDRRDEERKAGAGA
jgi:DNA-binding transcriptional MerR regulator